MKKSIILLSSILLLISAGCEKEVKIPGTASLTIFNAMIGSDILVTNFNATPALQWYNTAGQVGYGIYNPVFDYLNTSHFNAYAGQQHVAFYAYPDTTVHDNPVIRIGFDLPVGTMNSLFLTGTVSDPDTLFTRDFPPYHQGGDSSMGIRFVNLSPGGLPVSVNLAGNAAGSELPALAYKGISGFRKYPVKSTTEEYVFEVRDAANGNFITSYTMDVSDQFNGSGITNLYRYANFTLAFYGDQDNMGPYPPSLQLIGNN